MRLGAPAGVQAAVPIVNFFPDKVCKVVPLGILLCVPITEAGIDMRLTVGAVKVLVVWFG